MRFATVVLTVTALIQVPTAIVLAGLMGRVGVPWPALVAPALLAVVTAVFFARWRPMRGDRKRGALWLHLVDLPYFVHWCASFVFAPLSIALAVVALVVAAVGGAGLRLPGDLFAAAWVACVGLATYAVYVRRRFAIVRRIGIEIDSLPEEFVGYRIVQLSDLHVGSFTPPRWLDRWVARANRQAADLVVVTGDLISSGDLWLEETARSLGRLRAKDGVVVALGNHDYFASTQRLVEELGQAGLEVLRNEGRPLRRGASALWLAAVDDTWQGRDDVPAALSARPDGAATVLLAHDPKLWREASRHGVELTLSGHTHGGQLAMPFASRRLNLARLGEPWSLGLYRQGRSSLYVHAGLGTTGPPGRLGVAPEIAVLTLFRAGGRTP